MGVGDSDEFPGPQPRNQLSNEQLSALDRQVKSGAPRLEPYVLSELLRVYREAIAFDAREDMSPFYFFFESEPSQ